MANRTALVDNNSWNNSMSLGGGGFRGPPNGQNHRVKCSATNMQLIHIKPLSRLAVVHSEVLHLLECLLGLDAVLKLSKGTT